MVEGGVGSLLIGVLDPPPAISVAPTVPFDMMSGPVVTSLVFEHDLTLAFYLDSVGDAVVLPGSAVVRSGGNLSGEDEDTDAVE